METQFDKVSEVSRATQAVPTAPPLPPFDDEPASALGDAEGFVSDEEEDVVLELDRLERLAAQQARFVRQRTKEQLSSRKRKVGFHHGHFTVLPAS